LASLVSGALLDTSTVIGDLESLRMELPATMAISVITLGELRAGVRLARDPLARAARQTRLNAVRGTFEPIAVDEAVAEHYGDVLAAARSAGRSSKATDLLIIATAAATGRVLYTLDRRQAALAQLAGIPLQAGA
jgi:predicted nucleic acid-binding protein